MFRICLLFMLILAPTISNSAPFKLNLQKKYEKPPALPGYKLLSGSVLSRVVYLKMPPSQSGVESEVHIHFLSKRITQIVFIFGPRGVTTGACMSLYKKVNSEIRKRYGPHKRVLEVKDPIIDDLVLGAPCTHVNMGAYFIETHWYLDKMRVVSYLFGDDDGLYIEVHYRLPGYSSTKDDLFKDL